MKDARVVLVRSHISRRCEGNMSVERYGIVHGQVVRCKPRYGDKRPGRIDTARPIESIRTHAPMHCNH